MTHTHTHTHTHTYTHIHIYICIYYWSVPDIGMVVRVFANGPGDLGSVPRLSHTNDSKKGTRGERHNSYYADPPHQCAAHLVMFKISVGRDPKNPTTSFNGQNSTAEYPTLTSMVQSQLTSFHILQFSGQLSSRHDVIHTPAPFPVWGFIMTMVIVISFAHERKLHQMTMHLD